MRKNNNYRILEKILLDIVNLVFSLRWSFFLHSQSYALDLLEGIHAHILADRKGIFPFHWKLGILLYQYRYIAVVTKAGAEPFAVTLTEWQIHSLLHLFAIRELGAHLHIYIPPFKLE